MATRRSRKAGALAIKSAELAMAVPQVVAHRVARMALAGPRPSARDRKEFQLMVSEKQAAFAQAWIDMSMQVLRAQQAMAMSMFGAFFSLPSSRKRKVASLAAQGRKAALDVAARGLAPVHRKATANARRLAGARLR